MKTARCQFPDGGLGFAVDQSFGENLGADNSMGDGKVDRLGAGRGEGMWCEG